MLLLVAKGGALKNRVKLAGILLTNALKILFSTKLTVMIIAKNEQERKELARLANVATLSP